jgi:transcriptional regulator with XRE-family HTH domain
MSLARKVTEGHTVHVDSGTNVLATRREAFGYSLDELSLLTGISRSVLHRAEIGQGSLSDEDRLRVSRALRISSREARAIRELRPHDEVPA